MNVILNIDYNRFAMSIEDAAKVMALLGKARSISSRYDSEADRSYLEYDKTNTRISIEEAREPIRDAE